MNNLQSAALMGYTLTQIIVRSKRFWIVFTFLLSVFILSMLFGLWFFSRYEIREKPLLSPVALVPIVQAKEQVIDVTKVVETYKGTASYYSEAGCLGCNAKRKMANGEILDDSKLTVAMNNIKLNTKLRITNLRNGRVVNARVTDRGGFNKYGRLLDVSLAVKQLLDLKTDKDLLKVEVL